MNNYIISSLKTDNEKLRRDKQILMGQQSKGHETEVDSPAGNIQEAGELISQSAKKYYDDCVCEIL